MTAGRPAPGAALEGPPGENPVAAEIAAVWDRVRDQELAAVDVLEDALAALAEGRLGEAQARDAEREAHRLAGSAGVFGFTRASVLARELEAVVSTPGALPGPRLRGAFEAVQRLRAELAAEVPTTPAAAEQRPVLVVVHEDPEVAAAVALAAEARGLAGQVATGAVQAEAMLDTRPSPAVAVVDLDTDGALALASRLATGEAPVPVLALVGDASFVDRVEAVRAGVRGFLPADLSPAGVAAAAAEVVATVRAGAGRLVAVDDDQALLAGLAALLRPTGHELVAVGDAQAFWSVLEETAPDLVLLDLDMPGVSGLELCRLLRAEPRWAALPVIFLTASVDRDTVQAIFTAGADDYVAKPVVGTELLTRIGNRLERAWMLRSLAERDFLTGLANRRALEGAWPRLRAMADRFRQPLSFALVDLDRFKQVNDRHGHAAGDAVLGSVGQLFSERFGGEDVAARWGGEELAVLMYGMTRADGVRRVTEVLAELSAWELSTEEGRSLRVTCSAGVSEYGVDGTDLEALYHRADDALYRAKALGRARVLPAGWTPGEGAGAVEVVVVEDDPAVVALVVHALETRGYATVVMADGEEAIEALTGPGRLRAQVILLDINLAGVDGFAVLDRLAAAGVTGETRVIVVSARATEAEVLRALELGAVDHVAKPFSVPVLMQRVRRALAR